MASQALFFVLALGLGRVCLLPLVLRSPGPQELRGSQQPWGALVYRFTPLLAALIVPPALAALGAWFALDGTARAGGTPDVARAFLLTLVVRGALGEGLGEELGWRGFALPRLQQRLHPGVATLVLTGAWSLWHLPAYWIAGSDKHGEPFARLVAFLLAYGVVFAWIANRSGSALGSVVAHSALIAGFVALESAWPAAASSAAVAQAQLACFATLALAVLIATRGKLGVPTPYPGS